MISSGQTELDVVNILSQLKNEGGTSLHGIKRQPTLPRDEFAQARYRKTQRVNKINENELPPEEAVRLLNRREKNREAAARCRQKRVELEESLRLQTVDLQSEKAELETIVARLESEREQLDFRLKSHEQLCPKRFVTTPMVIKLENDRLTLPNGQSIALDNNTTTTTTTTATKGGYRGAALEQRGGASAASQEERTAQEHRTSVITPLLDTPASSAPPLTFHLVSVKEEPTLQEANADLVQATPPVLVAPTSRPSLLSLGSGGGAAAPSAATRFLISTPTPGMSCFQNLVDGRTGLTPLTTFAVVSTPTATSENKSNDMASL